MGDPAIGLTAGSILKDENQDPIDHQDSELMRGLLGMARIRDLAQPFKQCGQLLMKYLSLPGEGLEASGALLLNGIEGAASTRR
jgi:hypothetical protein